MKIVKCKQMRTLDAAAINDHGILGAQLMDNAGLGVARSIMRIIRLSRVPNTAVTFVAGKGNNGGDAFVAARYLRGWHVNTEVLLAAKASDVTGDAAEHLDLMKSAGVPFRELPEEEDWTNVGPNSQNTVIIVDAILGTGINGAPRGTAAAAIQHINEHAEHSFVISIDIPSGLDADTGAPDGDVVIADMTITMGLPKQGFFEADAEECVGTVEVVDIGIPPELVDDLHADMEMIDRTDVARVLTRRKRESHKGTYGHVLLVGGANGYAGAAGMAARAACRSGAGLVTAMVPGDIATIVALMAPEAMVHPGSTNDAGSLSEECLETWARNVDDFDAILVGPGMTQHPHTASIVEFILTHATAPVILDADALNVCRPLVPLIAQYSGPIVVTPHPGEMARLLATTIADVQSDRFAVASTAAKLLNATVVLKGHRTVVIDANQYPNPTINMTGNAGMATGGSGDVLSGIMAGLLAQSIDTHDAACASVFIHGRAGDSVALHGSEISLLAGDLINELPQVYREISGR